MDPNQKTLRAYNRDILNYLKYTPRTFENVKDEMVTWIDSTLDHLETYSSHILEIGSATPRDATYMRSKGFSVQCSDASRGFVDYLRKCGEDALLLNVLTDQIPKGLYDMVFANAVVSHFTKEDLRFALKNIYNALPEKGVFAFSAKEGDGETWVAEKSISERFIHYWQIENLTSAVEEIGYRVVFINTNAGDLPHHRWINIVAQKIS